MLRSVFLHGSLAERFGSGAMTIDIETTGEAVRALSVLKPGFGSEIRRGAYHILAKHQDRYLSLGEEDIPLHLGVTVELHIVPVVAGAAGSQKSGILKIVLGVALAAGAFFMAPAAAAGGLGATAFGIGGMGVTYGQLAMVGVALAIAGAASMLSPTKKDKDKDQDSYIISNADNVADQGASVPVVVGRFLTGSVVMSIGVSTEQIGSSGLKYPGQD